MRYGLALLGALFLAPPVLADAPPAIEAGNPRHERQILVEGARNFRDVGGYRTADGRTVRWGALYRSGSLGGLTSRGMSQIDALGIGAIIDLRTTHERQLDRNNWLALSDHGYWRRDYGHSLGDLKSHFGEGAEITVETTRAMMLGAYGRLAREQAEAYRELFARLAGPDRRAVVVNCTAGKDRTGIAAALVLTAIGVPYETVREDFLLSNGAPGMDTLQAALSGPLAALPPEVAQPIIGVEPEYLDVAFSAMRRDYGSVEAYLRQELGVGPAEVAAIRRRLLEP